MILKRFVKIAASSKCVPKETRSNRIAPSLSLSHTQTHTHTHTHTQTGDLFIIMRTAGSNQHRPATRGEPVLSVISFPYQQRAGSSIQFQLTQSHYTTVHSTILYSLLSYTTIFASKLCKQQNSLAVDTELGKDLTNNVSQRSLTF